MKIIKLATWEELKTKNGEILKAQKSIYGYMRINLYKRYEYRKTIVKSFSIHRLVLENFNPVKNMNKLQVNHIDCNRSNNALVNLEWTTPAENCNRKKKKEKFYNSIGCYDELGNYFNSYREAGAFYDISPNTIKRDCLGKTQKIEANYKNRKTKRMTFHS